MLVSLLGLLILTPTNTVVKASIDLAFPKTPISIFSGDYQSPVTSTASDKIFFFATEVPGIFSMNYADFTNRDITISKLPDQVAVGSRSLFYMKRGTNTDFVFTDKSRKNVFYGSNASGYPVISRIACGPFSEISDIHLTESASNTTAHLIVGDKGASSVYSYTLTPSSATSLCTLSSSLSLEGVQWIQSLTGGTPTVYLGYATSAGLSIRSYQSGNLTPVSAAISLTSSLSAKFGKPLFDSTGSDLYIPVKMADDSVGSDYVVHYDNALTTRSNISTCRSPDQVLVDFEGTNRWHYFFCPVSNSIQVYNASDTFVRTLPTGSSPLKMAAGSDGTNRFITVLQSKPQALLNKIAVATNTLTTSTLNLPYPMSDLGQLIGTGGATDRGIVIGPNDNVVSTMNLTTQALIDTLRFPKSISSIAAESSTAADFVSALTNTAYSLSELNSSVWRARFYDVGTYPLQIFYRANRLYTLNRDSNSVSVIDTSNSTVTSLPTQTRPISMDFSTATNSLWVANQTSASVTRMNITVGNEIVATNAALSFTPQKLVYQSSDATVYVGGQTSVRALNGPDLATVSTQTLSNTFSDLAVSTGGVTISSKQGYTLYTMDRSSLSTATLSSPPHLLTSNRSVGVAGLLKDNKVTTFANLGQSLTPEIKNIFSNLTNLFVYFSGDQSLYAMPYSLFSSINFPGMKISLSAEPEVTADDGSGNLWMGDSAKLKFQRLTANLQRSILSNLVENHPEDLVTWAAQSRVYVALRELNALAIVNLSSSSVAYYSVCKSPRQIKIDTSLQKLFILCSESDSVTVVSLTAAGAYSSQTLVATDRFPSAMALDTSNSRLYIANQKSNTVLRYNSSTNAFVSRTIVHEEPRDIAINTATNAIVIAHQGSSYLTQISSSGTSTDIDVGSAGFSKVAINPSSSQIFAISPSLSPSVFFSPSLSLVISGTTLTSDGNPMNISVSSASSKAYITYPLKGAVSIAAEAGTQKDVAVGDFPVQAFPVDAASKVFVSNFLEDSMSVISTSTDLVTATLSLTSGCGPTKMAAASVSSVLYLYVLCQSNDSLEIIDTSSNVVGTPISLRIPN